jgi:hypothetical protein
MKTDSSHSIHRAAQYRRLSDAWREVSDAYLTIGFAQTHSEFGHEPFGAEMLALGVAQLGRAYVDLQKAQEAACIA